MKTVLRLSAACFLTLCHSSLISAKQPNVLFIAVDDLRLQAPFFGQNEMITPGLQRLADQSVVFSRAYCSVPVCGASRASLMSGVRPNENRFFNYYTRKDTDLPGVPSLARWFKDFAYSRYHYGESIISDRYVYTEWNKDNKKSYARMLYDHKNDPKENVNVSENPEYSRIVSKMKKQLDGVRKTLD